VSFAKCHLLSVILLIVILPRGLLLNVIFLSVILLIVILPRGLLLNAILPNVIAPDKTGRVEG
jgi:hypothetical protein